MAAGIAEHGRGALRLGLLAASAAGTAAMLLVSPTSPADVTFPLLLLSLVPLGGLVVLEHRRPTISRRVLLGVAGGLLLLAVVRPPQASHDVWSYAMYGRVVATHHVSPYAHRPAEFASDPALARVSPGWRQARSVYGPGFTAVSAAIMAVAGDSGLAARIGFQALAASALLAVGVVLARVGVPTAALAAVVLNPLIVVGVANGGHNDALVGLALLLTTLALHRRRPAAAGLLLAAAVLVKAVAVLPAIACLLWVWRHAGRRAAAAVAAWIGIPVMTGYAAFGGYAAIAPIFASAAHQSRASVWRRFSDGAVVPPAFFVRHVGLLAALAVLGLTTVLVWARSREASAAPVLIASLTGYLLLARYVLPWYFAWALPVAALDAESPLSRLLAAQTVMILVAYQYQVTRHGDGLDRFLGTGVGGAQLFAATAAALLVLGAAVGAVRRHEPLVSPSTSS